MAKEPGPKDKTARFKLALDVPLKNVSKADLEKLDEKFKQLQIELLRDAPEGTIVAHGSEYE